MNWKDGRRSGKITTFGRLEIKGGFLPKRGSIGESTLYLLRLCLLSYFTLTGSVAYAGGAVYAFGYTFADRAVVTGSFTGIANGDRITDISDFSWGLNGIPHVNLVNEEVYGAVNPTTLGAVMPHLAELSFSGEYINLLTYVPLTPQAHDILWLFNTSTPTSQYRAYAGPDRGFGNAHTDNPFNTASWHVSVISVPSPVPEPEAYALMIAGLVLMGFATRCKV